MEIGHCPNFRPKSEKMAKNGFKKMTSGKNPLRTIGFHPKFLS